MKETDLDVDYTGVDIVAEMIQGNQEFYGNDRRRFVTLDLTKDDLPKLDLIFCRDALVHFSFEDTFVALKNIKRSGSRYLLTTTFTGRDSKMDIQTGKWRPLNLQMPPPSNSQHPPQLSTRSAQRTTGAGGTRVSVCGDSAICREW